MTSYSFWKELYRSVREYCDNLKKDRLSEKAIRTGILGARRFLKELEDREIPVNLLNCACYLNAEIVYYDSLVNKCGADGLTVDLVRFAEFDRNAMNFISKKNGCRYIIIIDSNLNDERKRFVIAHELGHIYLRHTDIREKMRVYLGYFKQNAIETGNFHEYYRQEKKTETILRMHEIAANAFAGELLVPSSVLKRYICSKKIRDVFTLAEIFIVSHYVVLVQLGYLNLLDVVEDVYTQEQNQQYQITQEIPFSKE